MAYKQTTGLVARQVETESAVVYQSVTIPNSQSGAFGGVWQTWQDQALAYLWYSRVCDKSLVCLVIHSSGIYRCVCLQRVASFLTHSYSWSLCLHGQGRPAANGRDAAAHSMLVRCAGPISRVCCVCGNGVGYIRSLHALFEPSAACVLRGTSIRNLAGLFPFRRRLTQAYCHSCR